jgi:hypothetical protein
MLIGFHLSAQRVKDVLYLKNGSIIYGKLLEIKGDTYKMQASDGSIFIYKSEDVEKFAKESPLFEGRKSAGFGFALEAGLLAGEKHSDYSAPFSFNILAGVIINTKNIISFGSGVEFLGKPYTPLLIEYKYLISNKKVTPFVFLRGGGIVRLSGSDAGSNDNNYIYNTPFNYRGGASFALGTGLSWAKEDYETYLSFAYRYAHTTYQEKDYNQLISTFENSLNRLEMKFGFRF